MSSGANVLPTYELESNGYDVSEVQQMVLDMGHVIAQYKDSKEKTYVEEILRDIYPHQE